MVSLSKSIQQVTNREAVGVLQGQRLANSQYDDNSMLAFSFPEETDSPWQLRPKMFAYFCSNTFSSAFRKEYSILQICSVPSLCVSHTSCISQESSNQYGFPLHTHAWNQTVPIIHKRAFLHVFFSFFFFVAFILSFKRLQRCGRAANQWEQLMFLMAHGLSPGGEINMGKRLKPQAFFHNLLPSSSILLQWSCRACTADS